MRIEDLRVVAKLNEKNALHDGQRANPEAKEAQTETETERR